MFFSASFIALALPFLALGAPVPSKRVATASDMLVFTFADVLEQLETQFYTQALAKFTDSDFTAAGFSSSQIPLQQFQRIMSDEQTHSSILQDTIKSFGAQPITNCNFDFSSVLTDVATMAATARVVENVGVGAYLGGATLISDPVLLDAAGSILTVEARHQTILNILNAGSAIPDAFDIALTPSEVLALAGPFISGCDTGIPANPVLSVTNTGAIGPGTQLQFKSDAINGSTSSLFCQMLVGGAPFSIPLPFDSCVVPNGINGPVAIFVTSDGQPLNNNVRDRATTQLVAGPTMAFIDTTPEMISMILKAGSSSSSSDPSSSGSSDSGSSDSGSSSSGSSSVSVTTATISPSEASAIISGASATTSASTPSATSSSPDASNDDASTPGGPNMFVGPSPDGMVTVNGWSNLPGM
jgi:hypothetical protein